MRVGAWIATGLAVVGLSGAVVTQVRAQDRFGSTDRQGSFAYEREAVLSGDESRRESANQLRSEVQNLQLASYIGAGAGAAAAITATFLWISGDDPGRYQRFKGIESVGVVPSGTGANLLLSGRF